MKAKACGCHTTGSEIRALRLGLGLDVVEWSRLLGVAQSTAYRWEKTKGRVGVDPLQRSLLKVVRLHSGGVTKTRSLGDKVRRGLLEQGNLGALHALLSEFFNK